MPHVKGHGVKIPMNDSNRKPVDEDFTLTESEDPSLAAYPKSARAAIAKRKAAKAAAESAQTQKLPLWPEPVMGVPNELIRSALFAAVDGHKRSLKHREPIASQGDTVISFTGAQLTQAHLDVFQGIMHLSRGIDEDTRVSFSAHALLKLIGRHTGKFEHDWLYGMILDLASGTLLIEKADGEFFVGAMIACSNGNFKRGNYSVKITRQLINLFDRGFTYIQWEQRRKLKQKPLACWLQMYYSSHAKPYPVTVAFLHKQSGSNIAELRKFRQNLKAALEVIKAVGVIGDWSIAVGDRVVVERLSVMRVSGNA